MQILYLNSFHLLSLLISLIWFRIINFLNLLIIMLIFLIFLHLLFFTLNLILLHINPILKNLIHMLIYHAIYFSIYIYMTRLFFCNLRILISWFFCFFLKFFCNLRCSLWYWLYCFIFRINLLLFRWFSFLFTLCSFTF